MEKFELELTEKNIEQTIIDDYLDNNKKLCALSNLINEIDSNLTICIDGNWGCGKTFFINQFKYIVDNKEKYKNFKFSDDIGLTLKNIKENNIIVYYDAWKNDNHIDVFESIIYNILNEFPNYKNIVTDFKPVKDMLVNLGWNCASTLSGNIINKDLIDFDKIKTFDDLAEKIITIEEKHANFKELLKKILGNKRMILIIDELDRCNPIFATKTLETIKHFYDISNITTIIVANNQELTHTIKKQYGNEFDAYSYLNKFYDFIITLDSSKNIEYAKNVLDFSSSTFLPHDVSYAMFKKYNFSYRECNRFKTMYNMVKKHIEISEDNIFDENTYRIIFKIILPIIIAFKIKDNTSYIECVYENKNDALKNSLIYLENTFKKTHGGWLKNLAHSDKENVIETLISIYENFKNTGLYKDLFDSCIKMTL